IFMTSMAIFVVGSLLYALASSMEHLIVLRAVQGLGAAAINPIVLTIAGDLFSMQVRARIQSVLSTVWAIGAALGPLLGSIIVTALLLSLFVWVESRAPEPVVPLNLLRHRLLGLTSVGGLLVGACMYSNAAYLPLFVQGGQGGSPRDVAWVTGTMSVLWTVG